jgi:hypothetical protein
LKILVVTGKLAFETVSQNVAESDYDVDVRPLPVSVAAFITPQLAAQSLVKAGVTGYDLILLPGTVRGDVTPVEEVTGVPTFKGPSNMNDISLLLGLLDSVELSKTASATQRPLQRPSTYLKPRTRGPSQRSGEQKRIGEHSWSNTEVC